MRSILLIVTLFYATHLLSQVTGDVLRGFGGDPDAPAPLFSFSSCNLSIGSVHGIHPNQRNVYMKGYAYGEGDASIRVKGIPLNLSFRLSEEPYRSGRPSYFRVGFDAAAYKKERLNALRLELEANANALTACSDSIHLLESKWSYWNLKKQELQHPAFPAVPALPDVPQVPDITAPGMPAVPDLPQIPTVTAPGMPDVPQLPQAPAMTAPGIPAIPSLSADSVDLQLSSFGQLLKLQQAKLSDLQSLQTNLQSQYQQLFSKTDHGLFDGIRRLDLGLSALSPGSLSRNAVPMQGIHAAGTIGKTFYDLAAGFTLPNQLFSNQAFDQLINNTSNVFNAGDFFAVNAIRYVSSAVAGYGEKDKNAVSVESFYTGRSWEAIRKQQGGLQQATTNLAFCLTPKQLSHLTWTGSLGHSFSNDPNNKLSTDRSASFAYSTGLSYAIPKWKGQLKAFYRKLGTEYDGWSQGIFLRGAEHADISYRQALTHRLSMQLRGAEDRYLAADSSGAVRKTRQGSTELQWKLSQHTIFTGSYTLLELLNDTLAESARLSHMAKAGLYHNQTVGSWKLTGSFDGGYARIAGPDSSQRLLQLTAHALAAYKKWEFGLRGTYTQLEGLSRLYGESWCIQPELGYKTDGFSFQLNYQWLHSEQFGTDGGLVFRSQLDITDLFTVSLLFQRWLPTEYTFFMIDQPGVVKPIYLRWKLTLHLN